MCQMLLKNKQTENWDYKQTKDASKDLHVLSDLNYYYFLNI